MDSVWESNCNSERFSRLWDSIEIEWNIVYNGEFSQSHRFRLRQSSLYIKWDKYITTIVNNRWQHQAIFALAILLNIFFIRVFWIFLLWWVQENKNMWKNAYYFSSKFIFLLIMLSIQRNGQCRILLLMNVRGLKRDAKLWISSCFKIIENIDFAWKIIVWLLLYGYIIGFIFKWLIFLANIYEILITILNAWK